MVLPHLAASLSQGCCLECGYISYFDCVLGGLCGGLSLCFVGCFHVVIGHLGGCLKGDGFGGFLVGVLCGLGCLG